MTPAWCICSTIKVRRKSTCVATRSRGAPPAPATAARPADDRRPLNRAGGCVRQAPGSSARDDSIEWGLTAAVTRRDGLFFEEARHEPERRNPDYAGNAALHRQEQQVSGRPRPLYPRGSQEVEVRHDRRSRPVHGPGRDRGLPGGDHRADLHEFLAGLPRFGRDGRRAGLPDPHLVLLADRQPLDLLLRVDPGAAWRATASTARPAAARPPRAWRPS